MKIAMQLPTKVVDNSMLAKLHPDWTAEKIFLKTGIASRRIVQGNENTFTLAKGACENLFKQYPEIVKNKFDYLIYCTQTPHHGIPNDASCLQAALDLPTALASVDINQGCSGYIYGLSLAKGVLASGQANQVLLVTTETYSRHLKPEDIANRVIFGDGATATVLTNECMDNVGPFVFGTDGRGKDALYLNQTQEDVPHLVMVGPEVFNFTLQRVPQACDALLTKAQLSFDDVDHVIFHQANAFMLKHLQQKLSIPDEKFHVHLEHVGNTVSNTIPITLQHLQSQGRLTPGERCLLLGFGVGLSWAGTLYQI